MNPGIQRGFTLIELLCVVVTLGVLAAVTVPKFIELRGQARMTRLQSMAGALQVGLSNAMILWTIQGKPPSITFSDGTTVAVMPWGAPRPAHVRRVLTNGSSSDISVIVMNDGADRGYSVLCLDDANGNCSTGTKSCALRYIVDSSNADGYIVDSSRVTEQNCLK